MTKSRLIAIFALFLLAFSVVIGRLFLLAQNTDYAQTAKNQTITTLTLEQQRGNLYDTNGHCLTRAENRYFALSIPGESSYAELFQYVSYEEQATLYKKRNAISPFLVEVNGDLNDLGVYTYTVPQRYYGIPIAEHLIGYLDGDGHGVSGLELAYDDILSTSSDEQVVECATTAQGSLLEGSTPSLATEEQGSGAGVELTLDAAIQRACEGIAHASMEKGCILVADVADASVLASVSVPEFDPNDIQKSIDANDTSLINRAFSAFNAGSVFKVVLAAAAYEEGLDWFTHTCEGSIEVGDQTYRCALGKAHGTVNLRGALEQSCNCYFVALGQALGAERVLEMAQRFGFGKATAVAGGLKTSAGTLPDLETLQSAGQLAMFSFGQGELIVTPLQVTSMMLTVAGDGNLRRPSFVRGIVDSETVELLESPTQAEPEFVCSPDTARVLRSMLQSVVEEGIGGDAAPKTGTAGGKTGTAQTGQFDAEGEELLNYWFSGFYPAENPRYVITVLQDAVLEPEVSSAAIFARVADAVCALENG